MGVKKLLKRAMALTVSALLCSLAMAQSTGIAYAAKEEDAEIYRNQAVYIYKFVSYFEWPKLVFSGETKNIDLCILGKDTLDGDMDKVAAVALAKSNLKINIRRNAEHSDLTSCNIAYISVSEQSNVDSYLSTLKQHPILTISEIKDFADKGGIVEYTIKRGKLGLKTNAKAAAAQNLKVNSELLEASLEVIK